MKILQPLLMALTLAVAPATANSALAQAAPATEITANATAPAVAPAPTTAAPETTAAAAASNASDAPKPTFDYAKPVEHVGQPSDGAIGLEHQVTANGEYGLWMHDWILMPVMTGITILVFLLLLFVVFRFNRRANPVPSKTSHNTLLEVAWTLIPILILIAIALPSWKLLFKQYEPAPADAVTIKVTGNQWNWSYEYPDYKIGEYTSNMLDEEAAKSRGEPYKLGVDERVVVPVGKTVKLILTASDVIHSWAVPAFWIKMDAVPGRINEVTFTPEKTGVYYGQCSELCGIKHGFMPIAVEVVTPERFAEWVKFKGGSMPGSEPVAAAAPAATPATTPAATPAAATDNAAAPATNAADNAAAPAAANATTNAH